MMTSTKVAIWTAAGSVIFDLLGVMSAPSGLGDPNFEGAIRTARAFQGFAGILLMISIISIIITGYKKIMSKETSNVTNISGHQINATGFATVATDHAVIDQRKISRDSQISFLNNDENLNALQILIDYVSESDMPPEKKKYAELIISNIQEENKKNTPNSSKTKTLIRDLVDIVNMVAPASKRVLEAIKTLKEFL